MKVSKQFLLIIGVILVFASAAWSAEIEDDADQTERNIQTRGIRSDQSLGRHHPHHHHHHDHLAHLHHAHLSHAHHLHHFAHHHPILTKKLVLLKLKKLKKVKPHIIKHHHLHHKHHHLHHAHHHHPHHAHLHHLHHHPFHHHFFRTQTGENGYIELVPVEQPVETSYATEPYEPTPIEFADGVPTIQTYGATPEYIQPLPNVESEPEVDGYEPVPLEDIPDISPVHKHLPYEESSYDPSSSVFLYAVPESSERARSAPR